MKRLLIITLVLFSWGCNDNDVTKQDILELSISAYELGYIHGYIDGGNGDYLPSERAATVRKILEGNLVK